MSPDETEYEPERCPDCHMPLTMHHDPGCSQPCGACEAAPRRYTFTRDQLIDALRNRKPPSPLDGTVRVLEGDAAFESMADRIIEALETERRRSFRASLRDGGDNG
jgi:hypothetical protein